MRKDDTLNQLLSSVLPRLEELWLRANAVPEEQELLIWESIEQLTIAFEEVHVAMEELQVRNEELEALNQSLAAECRRYHELFNLAPAGCLVTDLKGVIQKANQAAAGLLNIPQTSYLVGKPLYVFMAEEARREFYNQLHRLQTNKEIKGWRVQLHPRQAQPFSAICTVGVVQSQGQPVSLQWMLQDVLECKQAEVYF